MIVAFNPSVKPMRLDTLAREARFGALSPDGKFVAYQSTTRGDLMVSNRASNRRVQVWASGSEPLWLSANELLFRDTPGWFVARLDLLTGDVIGRPQLWPRDPRFSDTPGYSQRTSPDGGIVYVQAPEPLTAPYLRVVPRWVEQMKRRVDDAARP